MRDSAEYTEMRKSYFLDRVSPNGDVVISRVDEYDSLMDYAADILQYTVFRPVYEFESEQGLGLLYEGEDTVVAFLEQGESLGISQFTVSSSVDDKAGAVREASTSRLDSEVWEDIELEINGSYGPNEAAVKLKEIVDLES
ncbi:MAG: hypothetical protein R6V35_05705 [Candidatus Nanohaloarchaea archaeon]